MMASTRHSIAYTAGLDDDNPAREFRLGFDPNGRLQHSPQGVVCDPVSGIPYRRRTSDITYRIHRVTSGSAGVSSIAGCDRRARRRPRG